MEHRRLHTTYPSIGATTWIILHVKMKLSYSYKKKIPVILLTLPTLVCRAYLKVFSAIFGQALQKIRSLYCITQVKIKIKIKSFAYLSTNAIFFSRMLSWHSFLSDICWPYIFFTSCISWRHSINWCSSYSLIMPSLLQ